VQVKRKLYVKQGLFGRRYCSFVKVELTPEENHLAKRCNLGSVRIDPSVIAQVAPEVRAILNRIRNRWGLVISRTSGSVFLDLIWLFLRILGRIIFLAGRIFFGTRVPFRDMGQGAIFSASSIERLQDIEITVFTNLCAINNAIEYADANLQEFEVNGSEFPLLLPGLTFAGGLLSAGGNEQGVRDFMGQADDSMDEDDDLIGEEPDIDVGGEI